MSTNAIQPEALFQQLGYLLSHNDHRVTRSTMMGFPCLRVDDKFFACVERATGNLIVKAPAYGHGCDHTSRTAPFIRAVARARSIGMPQIRSRRSPRAPRPSGLGFATTGALLDHRTRMS